MQFERLKKSHKKQIIIGAIAVCVIGGVLTFATSRAFYRVDDSIDLAKGTINYKAYDFKIMAMYKSDDKTNYTEIDEMPSEGYTINESKSYCNMSNGSKDTTAILKTIDGNHGISKLKKNDKCFIYFDKEMTASEKLISTKELINENGYRYEGANPNNYILFNNELWRIIGVFNTQKSDGTKEDLIKIIRKESIGNIPWDNSYNSDRNDNTGKCDWSNSNLKKVLNEGDYYNKINNYSTTGLSDNSKEYIENIVWNLGGSKTASLKTEEFYNLERGNTTISGFPAKWTGKIGLMFPSDFGYASPSNYCERTTSPRFYYQYTGCYENNWLIIDSDQWTITSRPTSGNYFVYKISNKGEVYFSATNNEYGVRPVVYLKSDIKITEGNGTQSNPYIIS